MGLLSASSIGLLSRIFAIAADDATPIFVDTIGFGLPLYNARPRDSQLKAGTRACHGFI